MKLRPQRAAGLWQVLPDFSALDNSCSMDTGPATNAQRFYRAVPVP